MLNKIFHKVESIGYNNKLVTNTYQRGLQTIESKSAYLKDKLYFRSWEIRDALGNVRKLSQSYSNGQPIKGSQSIINYYA